MKKLEEELRELSQWEKEYQAISKKIQKDIEIKRATLITIIEQLVEKKVTVVEQINRELDAQSRRKIAKKDQTNSEERSNRVMKYINTIDLENFVQKQERPTVHQEYPEDFKENSQNNRFHTRNNQIENDLWRELNRVPIPIFNCDKRDYEGWKAAFMACVDKAPTSAEYKLLQLRQ